MHNARLATTALALLVAQGVCAQDSRFNYAIDDSQSDVEARVHFWGIASKTARFPDMHGAITLDPSHADSIQMNVVVDARTLTTGDSQSKILRGRMFFDAKNHPNVTFAGNVVRFTGERTADVTGSITARGVTRPATIAITFSRSPMESGGIEPLSVVGTTRIDRRDFGMKAFPLIVGNQVEVTIRARIVPAPR